MSVVVAPVAAVRSAASAARRATTRHTAPGLVLALATALVALRRAESPYADTDILWGARSGVDILTHHSLPRIDTYSWTASGDPWIPNSWAWNVVIGVAYRAGNYVGIALLGIVTLAGTGALLGIAIRRAGGSTAWGALITQVLLGAFALFLYPRAQLVDYAAVVGMPLLIGRALDRSRPRPALRASITLVLVQIAWMNLHTAAVLGPVMILAVGAARTAASRSVAVARRSVALAAFAALACLATPYGVAPITHLAEVRSASVGLISEWRPAGFGSTEQVLALVALALAGGACAVSWRRQAWDSVALLALFAVTTGGALRFAPMLILTSIPPLAVAAHRVPARAAFVKRASMLCLLILALLGAVFIGRFADPGAANTSPQLVAELPHRCRLVNDMTVGGAVILQRPDIKVSIDSRNDMYGRQRELTALRVLGDARFGADYVDANHVTCVLAPSGTALVQALSANPHWLTVARDTTRSLLILRGPG